MTPPRILATVGATLAVLLGTTAAAPALAEPAQPLLAASCKAATCNGKDPVTAGCAPDGKLVESVPLATDRSIKVELFHSNACQANWARSVNAPNGGAVLVTNKKGAKYVRNTDGAKTYVWTLMVDGTVQAQACLGPQNSDALTCTKYH
ncbi:hypothetical protein F4556_006916 [Kitasatospora gansuensis]|uniref:DUF2690 domain-containing protein n=1 Tax=Kitasatospora gansuensis TaxID=258050 RepID=A0A7W7SJ24_9ACTN|nr:DUF2690 domain-containing protein [Kitasatospora gansuensis]MBB4951381.1 hypothetical protein [Kitasatospora gansuensis]